MGHTSWKVCSSFELEENINLELSITDLGRSRGQPGESFWQRCEMPLLPPKHNAAANSWLKGLSVRFTFLTHIPPYTQAHIDMNHSLAVSEPRPCVTQI